MALRILPFAISLTGLLACGLPTQTADVEGHEVAYSESGQGSPAVVFEAGTGDDLSSWSQVLPGVAKSTRAFAYSRAGYGGSVSLPAPRDAQEIVRELRATLAALQIAPPYILVAHSFGGVYANYFARNYPDEVTGYVSVEGRPIDFTDACAQQGLTGCDPTPDQIAHAPVGVRLEDEAASQSYEEVRQSPPLPPDLPLEVIIGTGKRSDSADSLALWYRLQRELAASSTRGEIIEATKSDHNVQNSEPKIVVDAVLKLLSTQ